MIRSSWIACALVGLFACGDAAAKDDKKPSARAGASAEPRPVQLVSATSLPLEGRIVIAGTLAAQDAVIVRSKVAGRLASIDVDIGTKVTTGQVLAQVELVDYRLRVEQAAAALAQAKALLGLAPESDKGDVVVDDTTGVREALATMAEARANFERSQTLVEKKLIGRADFDTANATFLRAQSGVQRAREEVYNRLALLSQRKAELAIARRALADASIRSPIDGVVQMRSAGPGEFLAQGAAVATVVRVDPLRLRVDVPERDAVRVEVGQTVSARIDEKERVYEGKVARISPMLNDQNRTLVVEASIPNGDFELRPGSFARATISLGRGAPAITVPSSSLVVFAGIEKVLLVEDGKAVERQVKTGRRVEGLVEIVSGVKDGETVVREPGTLQQGQPVVVRGETMPARALIDSASERDTRIQ